MATFYEKYKKLRRSQKIELIDIENRTKIGVEYLEAIESGNFNIIQEPYLRLFLRAYINEIGGNPDEAIDELSDYLLNKEHPELKSTPKVEKKKNTPDKKELKETIIEKKQNIFQDISLVDKPEVKQKKSFFGSNILKGLLLILFWILVIYLIRYFTLNYKDQTAESQTNQTIETITDYISFEQLQADYYEVSSIQSAIDQQLPLVVKIVSNKALGLVSFMDSLDIQTVPIAAGDQQTYNFNNKLDIVLNHSNGVTAFVNGNSINDINSQSDPVRLIFSTEPKSVTIKHYSRSS